MLDYQRIVDDVRSSLFSNSPEGVDFLRSAAADYAVACDEINERLRRCGALLKQGLRSEAIQLAEIEPNLLDLVATLDFPEREQWVGVVGHYGIIAPPPLLLDVAADLNEAYAIEQPLAQLLRKHRLRALARAPLQKRISTLRKLALAVAINPIWREDLLVFEKERQKQLHEEVAEALKSADATALATLDDELQGNWLEPPSVSLINRTAEARRELEDKNARAELVEATNNLNECHAQFDVDMGRQWRDQWNEVASRCNLETGDDLLQQAQQALEWLADQDLLAKRQAEHSVAVVKLTSAIHGDFPAKELMIRRDRARAHGFELSADLERSYRVRLHQLAQTAKRRRRITMATVTVSLLLIAGLSALGVARYFHKLDVEHNAEALNSLLDANNLPEAQAFLDRLKAEEPSIAASDPIKKIVEQRLEPAGRREAERHAAFEAAMQQAKAQGPTIPTTMPWPTPRISPGPLKSGASCGSSRNCATRPTEPKAKSKTPNSRGRSPTSPSAWPSLRPSRTTICPPPARRSSSCASS